MKILFVISRFEIGGIVAFVDGLCRELAKKGIKAAVMGAVEVEDFSWDEYFAGPKIRTHKFIISAKKRWQKEAQLVLGSRALFQKIVKKGKPDLIVFNHPGPAFGILLSPASWGTPAVYHFHGAWDEEERSGYFFPAGVKEDTLLASWKRAKLAVRLSLYHLMEMLVLLRVRKIFVFSPASKKLILEHFWGIGKGKIVALPPGIDRQQFRPKDDQSKPKQALGLDRVKPLGLYLGRFDRKKGLDNLLFAAASLAKKGLNFQLLLVGPVDPWGRVEGLKSQSRRLRLGSRVKFLPAVRGEEKKKLLRAADLFVLPSTGFEAYPTVIMEALAAGLPVVATPAGGVPDMLKPIDKRLLASGSDPEALAERLKWFLGLSRPEREKLSQKCLSFARKHFDIRYRSDEILRAYREVVE